MDNGGILSGLEMLAPDVGGYTIDTNDGLYIPMIIATQEGNGDVGRYLDSLPQDRRVVVPNVMNARLTGMLVRRGFTVGHEYFGEIEELVEVYERRPGAGAP